MKTEITELLGIEYPVIQGGMAWVADYHLAAAVSNAGGLGLIAAGGAPAEWVREQIRETKKLTDKPFGVNIMLMNPEADKIAKVILEEDIKVVTTGAGSPEKYMADWKAAGVKSAFQVGTATAFTFSKKWFYRYAHSAYVAADWIYDDHLHCRSEQRIS